MVDKVLRLKVDTTQASQDLSTFARDTGKKLDSAKKVKLEANVATATLRLEGVRKLLKNVGDDVKKKRELIIDTNQAQSNLTEAKRKLQNFRNTGDETTSRLQKKFDGLGSSIKSSLSSFIGPAAIIGGIAAIGKAVVGLADSLEQNRIAFSTMLGSASEADQLLKDLSKFASKTPFSIKGIRDNAKQLLAMGIASEDLLPTLKSLGDVSAGLSVPLDRLALAYGQVISKGKLQGGELKQFTEAGVPLLAELQAQLGKTSAEIYDMISAGEISSDLVVQAFERMSGEGGKFANLMEEQSKTFSGVISNIGDSFSILGEKIGGFFLPALTSIAGGLSSFLALMTDAPSDFGEFQGAIDETKSKMDELEEDFINGDVTVEEYIARIKDLQDEYDLLISTADSLSDAIEGVTEKNEELLSEEERLQRSIRQGSKDLAILTEKYGENDYRVQAVTESLARNRKKLEENRIEAVRNSQVLEFLQGSFGGVSKAIDKISTAKTRGEFDALRVNALRLIQVFAKVGVEQLKMARAAGDTEGIDIAKERLEGLVASAKDIKNLEFVVPTAGPAAGGGGASGGSTGGGRSGKSFASKAADQAVKEKEKENKRIEKLNNDLYKKQKKGRDDNEKEKTKTIEKALKEHKKRNEDLIKDEEKLQKKASDNITKYINANQKKIVKELENGNKVIAGLEQELKDLGADTNTDIIDRVVEIDTELENKEITAEEKKKLEEERSQAFLDLTEEEKKALNTKIAEEQKYQDLTQIEKIKFDSEEKKKLLEAELEAEINLQEGRLTALEESQKQEALLQEELTGIYETEVGKRLALLQDMINKTNELNSIQGGSAAANTVSQATNNVTNNNKSTTNNVTVSSVGQATNFIRKTQSL